MTMVMAFNISHIGFIMVNKYFSSKKNPHARLLMLFRQKAAIEEHYSFLSCRIDCNVLICTGTVSDPRFSNVYQFEMRCVCGKEPYVKILEPKDIKPCKEIHMYDDHSLCLHYPPDMKWEARTPLYKFTLPWIFEWVLFYELFLINGGVWEGQESPTHISQRDKNVFVDTYNRD